MWAYVDETGNTGNNIFDKEQPFFITAAMMTRCNFDLVWQAAIADIAAKVGAKALHANELGLGRIDNIAPDLLHVLKKANARFFVSRLEKRYLAATKVVDTYFDQAENLAVPWHVYWLRPMRMMLTFKLASFVLTKQIAEIVWACLTAPSEAKSKAFFVQGAKAMLEHVNNLPDKRSRQIVGEALQWAVDNPENFTTHLRDKVNRYGHSPNFVAFTNVMDGIERTSKSWRRPIREIIHDEQSQFEKTLVQYHELYSRPSLADVEPLDWPGETEPITISKAAGSKFTMSTEDHSPGLQVIDILLWLFKRLFDGKDFGRNSAQLLNWAMRHAYQHDFSFSGVGEQADQALRRIMAIESSEEKLAGGAKMLADYETRRLAEMQKYAKAKSANGESAGR